MIENASSSTQSESKLDQVFHYASMAAMMNIVNTRTVWCTAIPYLNDATELTFLTDAVKKRLPRLKELDPSLDRIWFPAIEVEDAHVLTEMANVPFVASFAEKGDSLMHWRSYCPQNSGIAVGFRTECLEKADIDETPLAGMVVPNVGFGKVGYLDVRNEAMVDKIIYRAIENAQATFDKHSSIRDDLDFNQYFLWALEAIACANKHESFQVEDEYRLLLSDIRYRENNIRFRSVRSTLVPYVAMRVPGTFEGKFTFDKSKPWDAIQSVVIGPTPNMDLTKRSVEAFFRLKGMKVDVETSRIPYRDW